LLHLLLPPLCPLCRENVLQPARPFCTTCASCLTAAEEPWCPTCGLPYTGRGPSHLCPRCLHDPPPFEQVRVWGVYAGGLADAVQRFKYAGQLSMRRALEQLAVEALVRHYGVPPVSAVVPVPPHPSTARRRGCDLAALLARAVARAAGLPIRLRALRKVARTPDLVTLDAAQRRRAVAEAYGPRERLSGGVLLVDDVVTTTATARACATACLAAGADYVRVLALARTTSEPKRN
jgi:predicted amidophosphoribosyltransferase